MGLWLCKFRKNLAQNIVFSQESYQTVDIFGEEGCERGLPEKTRLCLPVLVGVLDPNLYL
jgi:hypothetical protein